MHDPEAEALLWQVSWSPLVAPVAQEAKEIPQ